MHNARASVPLARSPACGRPPPIYTEQALNSSTYSRVEEAAVTGAEAVYTGPMAGAA